MELKHADKVLKIVDNVKKLDKDIIQLEALAMQAANGESEVSVKFDVIDLVKKGDADNKVEFDEDGSIITPNTDSPYRMTLNLLGGWTFGGCESEKKNKADKSKTSFKEEKLKDVIAMQLFGLLLHYKQAERETLIKSLKRYGVKI